MPQFTTTSCSYEQLMHRLIRHIKKAKKLGIITDIDLFGFCYPVLNSGFERIYFTDSVLGKLIVMYRIAYNEDTKITVYWTANSDKGSLSTVADTARM